MNATLFDGGKVHRLNGQAAMCGVGKRRKRGEWQIDLGEVTCQRCAKIFGKMPKNTGGTPVPPNA